MVQDHLEGTENIDEDLALTIFYLIVFNKALCISNQVRISSREASMVKNLNFAKIKDMDFCQLVVDEIQNAAIKWQGLDCLKGKYFESLAVAPLIMYLDSLLYKDKALMGKEKPRVLFLNESDLKEISYADRNIAAETKKED